MSSPTAVTEPQRHPPVLLLLKGQPGSGKSTLAAALAAALSWPLVDKDDARSAFQHLAASHPSLDWNELSYQCMWRVAETQLRCGLSCLVDCPLARRALFDRAAALAAQYGAVMALVELQPGDAAEWRRRVEQRGAADAGTADAHKPGSWCDIQTVLQRNAGSEAWSAGVAVPLRCCLDSTALGTEQQLQAVLRMLREGGALGPAAPACRGGACSSGGGGGGEQRQPGGS